MRKLLSASLMILFAVSCLMAEKSIKIGSTSWYTEKNSFEEIIKIAKAQQKPILAVFSATWCGPCQNLKNTLFKKDDFKRVSEKAVLLYIEQTTKEGAAYVKKFKIKAFPTLKIFSSEGEFLDQAIPSPGTDYFIKAIEKANSGDNIVEAAKALKKDPNNRELILKYADKLHWSEKNKKVALLKKAIKLNPDFKDPLSHKIYEKAFIAIVLTMPFKEGPLMDIKIEENKNLLNSILKSYYPGNLKYSMKGKGKYFTTLRWFNMTKNYKEVVRLLNIFLQENKKADMKKTGGIIANSLYGLIKTGQLKNAENWLKKLYAHTSLLKTDKEKIRYGYTLQAGTDAFIKHNHEKNNHKAVNKYGDMYFGYLTGSDVNPRMKEFYEFQYALKYSYRIDAVIKKAELKNAELKGPSIVRGTTSLAQLYHKKGQKEKARKILTELCNKKELIDKYKGKRKASLLNNIAWSFVENDIADKTALKIAEEAYKLNPSPMITDTLAAVHAGMGNYKKAVEIQKTAIDKMDDSDQKEEMKTALRKWQKNIKK